MGKVIPYFQTFLLLFIVSLLLIGIDRLGLLTLPKQGGYYLTNPISFGLYRVRQNIGEQFHFIFRARFAAQENHALQEQIGELLSENANLRRTLAEAEAQIDQEKSLDPKTYQLITSRPIGINRYLKVDKGTVDGIKINQAAVFKDNYLGQVISVGEKGADIKLLADPDSKVAAFSFGKEGKAKGVLVGEFGTEMLLDKILHEENIEVGDLVYTEGTEEYLPRGLVIGRVTQVLENKNQIFKQAKVQPVFDIRDLELVYIIQD